MCDLTYLQVLEINNRKEKCISLGKLYEEEKFKYDKSKYSDYENIFIEFGRFCIYHDLNSDDYFNYEKYLECGSWDWNIDKQIFDSIEENKLYTFFRRLEIGEYKAIIVDERTPLILEDERNLEFWKNQLYFDIIDSDMEVGYDTLKIINKYNGEEMFLEGVEDINKSEIIARRWLVENCEFSVLVKDNPYKFRKDGYKSLEDCYELTKKVVEVHRVRKNPMQNFGCIKVMYKNNKGQMKSEIWQPN